MVAPTLQHYPPHYSSMLRICTNLNILRLSLVLERVFSQNAKQRSLNLRHNMLCVYTDYSKFSNKISCHNFFLITYRKLRSNIFLSSWSLFRISLNTCANINYAGAPTSSAPSRLLFFSLRMRSMRSSPLWPNFSNRCHNPDRFNY